ncbi:hypothetical protein Tco_1178308, partial [Tanacetum coccineum]
DEVEVMGVVVVELELKEWRSSERVSSDGDGSIDGGELKVCVPITAYCIDLFNLKLFQDL